MTPRAAMAMGSVRASVISNPGWQAHFDQGVASYNTQDGLDALHLIGSGSSMTITRTPGVWQYGPADQGGRSVRGGDQQRDRDQLQRAAAGNSGYTERL